MEYLPRTNIAVCATLDEQNTALREARQADRPCVFIQERQNYASVTCDMDTTDSILTDETVEKIRSIKERLATRPGNNLQNHKATVHRCIDATYISIDDLQSPNARDFAKELQEIVTDPSNQKKRLHYGIDTLVNTSA